MTRIKILFIGMTLLFACATAQAQIMPAPKKSPRTPVNSEVLLNKAAMPASRRLEGQADVLDAERLRLNGYEVRLYGVVPPQMSATNGPQARAVVDALAQGPVTCQIKDRDREGRLLALCHNAANADFGLELLRRGLAVSARGTLQSSDYAEAYLAAEQAAQNQRLGLWATGTPAAASDKSLSEAAAKAAATKAEIARLKDEEAKAKLELESLTAVAAASSKAKEAAPPAVDNKAKNKAEAPEISVSLADVAATTVPMLSDERLGLAPTDLLPPPLKQEQSFLEHYQLLVTGLLFLLTTLCVTGAVTLYRLRQKREDVKSIAAALRGELMAARSICQARLAKIAQDNNEKTTSWPRIRTLVFQAYVGRLGLLGADLSRQIASIYGQSSDYASYYNANDGHGEGASKRQAMESLVRHIEEVTPRLSQIEQKGFLPQHTRIAANASLPQIPPSDKQQPLSLTQEEQASPPPDGPSGTPAPAPVLATEEKEIPPEIAASLSETKIEVMAETRATKPTVTEEPEAQETLPLTQTRNKAPIRKTGISKPQDAAHHEDNTEEMDSSKRPPLAERAITKPAAKAPPSRINFAAPLLERLSKIKNRTAAPPRSVEHQDLINFSIPDYANLTEEELEALLYAEEEFLTASPVGKSQKTG
ncbi:MAG: thermonuclease family protein [Bdellovibrionales bacterium]|jgi:endonuclease YncB( thermonuclease family)